MVNLATFDLNLLRVLDAMLREGSTVRAGERLGLSQPAVSSALGRLRAALGDQLFLRVGHRMEPTQFAAALEVELRQTLDGIEAMLSPARFDPGTATDAFRISGSDFFAEMLMPKLGDLVSRQAPQMLLHLVDLVPDSYVAILEHATVDLALVPSTETPEWIERQPVFSSPFLVIARRGNPRLARVPPGGTVPIDLFCDMGHVLFSPEGRARGMGDAALAAVGRKRRVVMTMPVFSGVFLTVAASDLIALLPGQLAVHLRHRLPIEVYHPPMPVPKARLEMLWHRRHDRNPAHRWLRERVTEILAPLDTMLEGWDA